MMKHITTQEVGQSRNNDLDGSLTNLFIASHTFRNQGFPSNFP